MKSRNRGYIKIGTVIDVQIRDEYFVSASITPINIDKTEFKYTLSIHDTEAKISVELEDSGTITSTYKTINKDVTAWLNNIIDTGYFDEHVSNIKNMLECLEALLALQKRLKSNKEK